MSQFHLKSIYYLQFHPHPDDLLVVLRDKNKARVLYTNFLYTNSKNSWRPLTWTLRLFPHFSCGYPYEEGTPFTTTLLVFSHLCKQSMRNVGRNRVNGWIYISGLKKIADEKYEWTKNRWMKSMITNIRTSSDVKCTR